MKILVVENSLPVRERLLELLAKSGRFEAIGCVASSAVTRSIETHQPDAVLMDVRLDEVNGFQLLKDLRSRGFTKPVVMLSTSDDGQYPLHAEALGADAFLCKTTEFERIIPTLNRLLAIVTPPA